MHFAEPHGRTRICKLQQVILMFLISSGNSSYIKNNPCFAKIQTLIKRYMTVVNHLSTTVLFHCGSLVSDVHSRLDSLMMDK